MGRVNDFRGLSRQGTVKGLLYNFQPISGVNFPLMGRLGAPLNGQMLHFSSGSECGEGHTADQDEWKEFFGEFS